MEVAYDGTPFRGFAFQPDVPTVGGALEDTIEKVAGVRPELTCAGRTDAGVHARAQVVSFDLPDDGTVTVDLDHLQAAINTLLRPSIAVTTIEAVTPDFDARFSATSRRYRYTILNRPTPDPFWANTAWWIRHPLDLRALTLGCDPLIGEHDFTSFCRKPPTGGMSRRVFDAAWDDAGDGILHFWIEANAFCHQMVPHGLCLWSVGYDGRRRR
jgi:tRNA pseudouridine38-40 synthase